MRKIDQICYICEKELRDSDKIVIISRWASTDGPGVNTLQHLRCVLRNYVIIPGIVLEICFIIFILGFLIGTKNTIFLWLSLSWIINPLLWVALGKEFIKDAK